MQLLSNSCGGLSIIVIFQTVCKNDRSSICTIDVYILLMYGDGQYNYDLSKKKYASYCTQGKFELLIKIKRHCSAFGCTIMLIFPHVLPPVSNLCTI